MEGNGYAAVGDAIEAARAAADPEKDMVLVTGSIFLVADAYEYYKNKRAGETTK
jgi:folylpolyglutamate synthase/dihydropteroate synthase